MARSRQEFTKYFNSACIKLVAFLHSLSSMQLPDVYDTAHCTTFIPRHVLAKVNPLKHERPRTIFRLSLILN